MVIIQNAKRAASSFFKSYPCIKTYLRISYLSNGNGNNLWAEMVMGRNGYGSILSWAEMVMGRNNQLPS